MTTEIEKIKTAIATFQSIEDADDLEAISNDVLDAIETALPVMQERLDKGDPVYSAQLLNSDPDHSRDVTKMVLYGHRGHQPNGDATPGTPPNQGSGAMRPDHIPDLTKMVPTVWQLAPTKACYEMRKAGVEQQKKSGNVDMIFRAMLAAAPKPDHIVDANKKVSSVEQSLNCLIAAEREDALTQNNQYADDTIKSRTRQLADFRRSELMQIIQADMESHFDAIAEGATEKENERLMKIRDEGNVLPPMKGIMKLEYHPWGKTVKVSFLTKEDREAYIKWFYDRISEFGKNSKIENGKAS